MNDIKELAHTIAEEEFSHLGNIMTRADIYAYEYYVKGIIKGYELKEKGIEPLPFGEGNTFEKL